MSRPLYADNNLPIVDANGVMTLTFSLLLLDIINNIAIQGEGSPEGVVEATTGRTYIDLTGTTGNILYLKQSDDIGGDKTQGWVLT